MSDEQNAGGATLASSAVLAPFAEVTQEAALGAVRPAFSNRGAAGSETADANTSAILAQFAEATESADQGAVRPLMGASMPEAALTGTGFTYRHNWGPRRGQWTLRLNWGAINSRSRVLVSIAEGAAGGPDNGKFIGAARYTLHNVAPRAGGVDIWVNIEWSSDILLYVDYLVINP